LVASPGELVFAVTDGVLVTNRPGLGQTVLTLRSDDPDVTVVYADLGPLLKEPPSRLRAGDAIARVHKRGFVHVGVRLGRYGDFVDPIDYFEYKRRDT